MPGKWHKWALQPVIYLWHYVQGLFAVLYLCCLITYSCMQCKEMLYRLCSLQTNLHISFHHPSDVLLHQGTTFEELLLSSEIRNPMVKTAKSTSECSSTRPNFIPFLATRCLYWGVHLTTGQPDPKANYMSCWPNVIPLLVTICLWGGYIWAQVNQA